MRGPQKKPPVHKEAKLGSVVFSDLLGPVNVRGYEGSRYIITFIEGSARWAKIFLSPNKEGETVLKCFKVYKNYFERQNDVKIRRLHTDGGLEFLNELLDIYEKDEGIEHTTVSPYSTAGNGISERFNLTLMNSVRSMLKEAGLGHEYWPAAALQACRILNRVPKRNLGNISPYQKLIGYAPQLGEFKIFGCLVFARVPVPSEIRKKMDEIVVPTINLGTLRGYQVMVLDPDNGAIHAVSHAKF